MAFFDSLFSGSKAAIAKIQKDVDKINALEPEYAALSAEQIKERVAKWKAQLREVSPEEEKNELNKLLYDMYAATREVTKRTLHKRHFDVQILGGIALHMGKIAEMRTGEGKTQTAALPLALNALTGKGVHLVTVNDYLARWHASQMGPIYHALGLSVASIQHEKSFLYDPTYDPLPEEVEQMEAQTEGLVLDVKHMRPVSRKDAYAADITYGTNNEYGFDYLRDNMVSDINQMVQRGLHYAIVDEVDSILIDEARTPLIISAPDTDPTDKYYQFAKLVENLDPATDFNVDEKRKAATLTDEGIEKLEKLLNIKNIYEEAGITTVHHIEQALRARSLFKRDRDYVSRDNEIIIVDEFTGRLMFGRRYSDGLHQAIEAKEGVKIQQESKTLATITFQNYFRMYDKLAGMTGTASTEAEEFYKIYGLEVLIIPTNRPMIRTDKPDSVYKSEKGKFDAIVKDITERHRKGQPMLVGTVSIQKNELLAEYLRKAGLRFELLNAKNHEREAQIISQAGRLGAITVATNIAGRGVDILLGGNPVDPEEAKKVIELGGLHVIGTERHESRRIDNQLRGRSGRQGDPGSTQFFVSVEDDLMRLFGGSKLQSLMNRLGIPEDQPIEHGLVSKSIEQAQKKIEGLNFDTRKHVLEYDDIMNRQREVIYKKRKAWLAGENDPKQEILEILKKQIAEIVLGYTQSEDESKAFIDAVQALMPLTPEEITQIQEIETQAGDVNFALTDFLSQAAEYKYDQKEKMVADQANTIGGEIAQNQGLMRQMERVVSLQSLDRVWMDHLDTMDHLRDSVGLRGYGQRDPLVEYKREGYMLFQRALAEIDRGIAYAIFKIGVVIQPTQQMPQSEIQKAAQNSPQMQAAPTDPAVAVIGRNERCFCGSGKKWKKCGMLDTAEHRANLAKKRPA